jgi:hypothetical protein
MAPKGPKINKQPVGSKTRHVTLTILETLEIIRKPGLLQARASLWQHIRLDC